MSDYELVIRRGILHDGLGSEPVEGDVAISNGLIARVGTVPESGREEIDARNSLVAPGWVDIHTHYDGQATWDSRIQPSSNMGVTTVVVGNCGVGFAPVRATDHELLVRLMEGVEDIPGAALHEGLKWNWESFGDYLQALESLPHDIDIGTLVPHAALRVYVMGERGAKREPSTAAEQAQLRMLTAEAMRAGALGFSSSRSIAHRSTDNELTPSYGAARDELMSIAMGMADAGTGVMEFVTDNAEDDNEWSTLYSVVKASGRPMTLSMGQAPFGPDRWRGVLRNIEAARAEGLSISGQVASRAIGLLVGLQSSAHPFISRPSYRAIAHLPLPERAARMRDPEVRARILAEKSESGSYFREALNDAFDRMYHLSDPPDYEPDPKDSIAAQARARGLDVQAVIYDLMASGDGKGFLYFPRTNFVSGNLDAVYEMLAHPAIVSGLSDGGAHVGLICDASMPTFLLTHWGRDRTRGPRFDTAYLIQCQTSKTAAVYGLHDRGVLRRGYRADINIIAHDRLRLRIPEMRYDLPTGARRLFQEAEGYIATIVAGEVTYQDGKATGALPGRVIRGSRPAPRQPG